MLNLLAVPSVIAIGGLNFALIDLIFFGLLLIFAIIGYVKGFLKQIFSILGSLAAIVLSVLLCKHLAGFIYDKVPFIKNPVSNMVESLFGLEGIVTSGSKEQILLTLSTTKIPTFLHSIVANSIIESAGELKLTAVLTEWALVAISFVAIFIVSLILFSFIKKIFKSLTKIKAVGYIDRVLGLIFMALKLTFFALVLVTILSVFIDMNNLLTPAIESGERIDSYFNIIVTKIMNLPFIQNLFI